jgi:hypothetical protein
MNVVVIKKKQSISVDLAIIYIKGILSPMKMACSPQGSENGVFHGIFDHCGTKMIWIRDRDVAN